ncbi:MAG TPA: cyclase family protein [Solirubrobacteraceae bacterium]
MNVRSIVDLTQHLEAGMPVFPGIASPWFRDIARVADDGYAMSEYHLVNHIGTHVDAPAHQILDGATLDEIPLERLVTDALTLDFSAHEPGLLSLSDLAPHLDEMRDGDLVLVCSGNDRNWGSEAYWTGWCYPDPEASRAMIARGISGIGFDGPSADPVDTTTYELHQIWLSAGRLILENLARLTELGRRTPIVVAPMKVRDANGAPARVLAFPGSEGDPA